MWRIIGFVVIALTTGACRGIVPAKDAQRYLKGEFGGTIINSPTPSNQGNVSDGASYLVCGSDGIVLVVRLQLDAFEDHIESTSVSRLSPEVAACGDRLQKMIGNEKTALMKFNLDGAK